MMKMANVADGTTVCRMARKMPDGTGSHGIKKALVSIGPMTSTWYSLGKSSSTETAKPQATTMKVVGIKLTSVLRS